MIMSVGLSLWKNLNWHQPAVAFAIGVVVHLCLIRLYAQISNLWNRFSRRNSVAQFQEVLQITSSLPVQATAFKEKRKSTVRRIECWYIKSSLVRNMRALGEKNKSARRIQMAWRRYKTQKNCTSRFIFATSVQAACRRYLAIKRAHITLRENFAQDEAAKIIQRFFKRLVLQKKLAVLIYAYKVKLQIDVDHLKAQKREMFKHIGEAPCFTSPYAKYFRQPSPKCHEHLSSVILDMQPVREKKHSNTASWFFSRELWWLTVQRFEVPAPNLLRSRGKNSVMLPILFTCSGFKSGTVKIGLMEYNFVKPSILPPSIYEIIFDPEKKEVRLEPFRQVWRGGFLLSTKKMVRTFKSTPAPWAPKEPAVPTNPAGKISSAIGQPANCKCGNLLCFCDVLEESKQTGKISQEVKPEDIPLPESPLSPLRSSGGKVLPKVPFDPLAPRIDDHETVSSPRMLAVDDEAERWFQTGELPPPPKKLEGTWRDEDGKLWARCFECGFEEPRRHIQHKHLYQGRYACEECRIKLKDKDNQMKQKAANARVASEARKVRCECWRPNTWCYRHEHVSHILNFKCVKCEAKKNMSANNVSPKGKAIQQVKELWE